MANEQNLIPLNKRSKSERRETASKGGKASAEARRRKKTMKQNLELLLSLPVKDKKMKSVMKLLGLEEDEITNDMAMQVSMLKESLKGNVQAYKEIRDTIGEKPKEKVEVEGEIQTKNPLEGMTTEEIRKAIEMMNNDK